METVKLPLLSYEKSPGLSAVQQCAQSTGSVELNLVIFRQLLVGPYSLGQAGNGAALRCCLARSSEKKCIRSTSQGTRSHGQPPLRAARL